VKFAIKAGVRHPKAKTFAFEAQKTMYHGKHIAKGDTVYVFASPIEEACHSAGKLPKPTEKLAIRVQVSFGQLDDVMTLRKRSNDRNRKIPPMAAIVTNLGQTTSKPAPR
jgi:hypothetical protein